MSLFEYFLLDVTVQFTFNVLVDGIKKTAEHICEYSDFFCVF